MSYLPIRSASQLQGPVLVAISGMLFGLMGFLGTKLLYFHFSVENMLFWRFLIATLWMLISTLLFSRKQSIHLPSFRSLGKVFIFGALSYSGGSAFYFMASQHIGTGLAMVIFFSFPVFVTLFAWLWGGWHINRYALGSLLAVIVGLILLKGEGKQALNAAGALLAITAACCFAAYVYGSQHTTKRIDARLLTILVCLGNTLIFLILSLYSHSFSLPRSVPAWGYICAIGILATALPIQCLLSGLKQVSPVKASILSVLEPVVTVLIGLALLDESISNSQSLGILIVLLGAILIQFERTPNHL